jgi:signal transduction histidine kinase
MNARLRYYSIALAVVALAGLIGWVGQTTWEQLRHLRAGFGAAQGDGFHRSERVESSVRILSESLLRCALHPTPENRALWSTHGQELKQCVEPQPPDVTSPVPGPLMLQMRIAVDTYLAWGNAELKEQARTGRAPSSELILEKAWENATPILTLCQKLKASEHAALVQFVQESSRSVTWLQRLLLAGLVLLASFTELAILSLYRGTIAPLRVKLVETRAILERDERLAALGTMAAGMAHEIRNPLTAVNVRLHSLTRTLLPGSSEQEDALVIASELQRLDRMLRQFLQFAKPANPKMVTVSADYLLRKVEAVLAPHLAKACIQLDVEAIADSWVHVDPDQLEQVLVNLVKNAAESVGRNGRIILRARASPARPAGRAKPAVILEVSDTGPGVPSAVQPRLFDPFFTTKEGGTGLGLSIAARIIEQHGGTIACSKPLDCGATFTIVLPLAEKQDDEPASSDFAG